MPNRLRAQAETQTIPEPGKVVTVICGDTTRFLLLGRSPVPRGEHLSDEVIEEITKMTQPLVPDVVSVAYLPGRRYEPSEAKALFQPGTVFLDGSCEGATFIEKGVVSVNDHLNLMEKCTCAQTYELLQAGELDFLYDREGRFMGVPVLNHRDQDNLVAEFVLRSGKRKFSDKERKRLEQLIDWENKLDQALGVYPLPEKIAKDMLWIFEPIAQARELDAGGYLLEKYNPEQIQEVVAECMKRIEAYIQNDAQSNELEEDEVKPIYVGEAGPWSMFKHRSDLRVSIARLAKTGKLKDRGYVDYIAPVEGKYRYTIGNIYRGQQWEDEPQLFDMIALQKFLNEREERAGKFGRWGGGEKTCSNHGAESAFSPVELGKLLDEFLRTHNPAAMMMTATVNAGANAVKAAIAQTVLASKAAENGAPETH